MVANAVKFTEAGEVVLRLEREGLIRSDVDTHLNMHVEVTDDGRSVLQPRNSE